MSITTLNRIDEHSGAGTLPAKTIKVPVGKYRGLQFDFILDASAGNTIAATDLGTIEILHNSNSLGIVRLATLQAIGNCVGGVQEATSGGAGAAHTFSVYRPFHVEGDKETVLTVEKDNQTFVRWTPNATLPPLLDAAVNQVLVTYGEPAEGVTKYLLKIEEDDYILGAGNPTVEGLYSKQDVYWLWMENNTNVSRVIINVDGKASVDADRLAFNRYTHRFFELETYSATFTPILILGNPTDDLLVGLTDKIKVTPTLTAGDTITFITYSLDYDAASLRNSIASTQAAQQENVIRKTQQGKGAGVEAIQILHQFPQMSAAPSGPMR